MGRCILAIDPGMSGGVVFYGTSGAAVKAFKMPNTEDGLVALIEQYRASIMFAVVEAVTPFAAQGLGSTFKFGRHYGIIRGVLAAMKMKTYYVAPQKWQRELDIPKRGEKSKVEHKNVLKARAQKFFPTLPVTLATADALLLAIYGRKFLLPALNIRDVYSTLR